MMSLPLRRSFPLLLLAAIGACAGHTPPPPEPAPVGASLYRRLGGYDALAAVTDQFMNRLHADTMMAAFFAGLEKPALDRTRQMVVDQLCAATGGPCIYVGRTMKESHELMEITDAVFDRFVGHFQATMNAFAVPSREQNEVMAALVGMRGDIVTKR